MKTILDMRFDCARSIFATAFALAISCALFFVASPHIAFADVESDLADAESAVEKSAYEYEQAKAKAEEIDGKIAELTQRIAQLQEELPAQRAASNESLVALYKMQQEGCSLLDMLLCSEDFGEFFRKLEYINRIQGANQAALEKLLSMEKELSTSQEELAAQKQEADAQRAAAEEALAKAQELRASAQSAAEAQRAAEAQAAADAARAAELAQQEAVVTPDSNQGSQAAEQPSDSSLTTPPSSDNADWSSDKSSFVAQWAPRIDAYLGGSPLGGTGTIFAEAAWDYGVDPRWSPAISCVESSKGAACFRSHNAWGWGSSSWGSWDEAIRAHVRGLSRGYGYTVSVANAQKYCPPNWQHWYNRCCEEMNKI